jgi:hypothetical protein
MVAKEISQKISNDLTYVSVPTENIKHALTGFSTFVLTHDPSRLALACPIMTIIDQYFHAHFNVL